MKKIALFGILTASLFVHEAQCSVLSSLKTFTKNAFKTALYGAGTALTGGLSFGCYTLAQQTPELSRTIFREGLSNMFSHGEFSWENIRFLYDFTQNLNASQPVVYGAAAVFGLAALYSGFKTLQSTYKTLTFEE